MIHRKILYFFKFCLKGLFFSIMYLKFSSVKNEGSYCFKLVSIEIKKNKSLSHLLLYIEEKKIPVFKTSFSIQNGL